MNFRVIIFGFAAGLSLLCLNAQSPMKLQTKCDGTICRQIAQNQPLVAVIIKCDDSQAIAEAINSDGYQASAITGTIVTARIPAHYVPKIAENANIQYIQSPRQAHPSMTEARRATCVDSVQKGYGLETPFTGKGVIIGIIDQGFEYRHIAFLDSTSNPRVLAVWNRSGYSKGTDSEPTTNIPSNGDGLNVEGHATHVANIAAGSKIAENDYYGIAPDADLIMIPSELGESEIIEDVKYIRDFAAAKGEPWVINMSFGSQIGSHDGKDYFSQALDEILAEKSGRQIVVAAGNDGESTEHTMFTLKSDGDTVRFLIRPSSYGAFADIWSQTADSLHHINMRPFLYSDGTRDYRDSTFWSTYNFTHKIAPFNGKENYQLGVPGSALLGYYLGAEITGDKGTTVHAWTNYGYGDIVAGPDSTYAAGDKNYCIEDVGACANNTVTVSAYVTTDSYPNYKGTTENLAYGEIGDLAAFSSQGPALCNADKPTVAAPGSVIKSAVSKYGVGFDKTGSEIVQDVRRGIKHYYYGAMAGTSMATPMVTGIIALWLQAYPDLTYSQILDIIKSTSNKDEFTGSDEWNNRWGYGKIDAYKGLKEALKLAGNSGTKTILNSTTPVTLSRTATNYNILFNNNENFADISVVGTDGRIYSARHFSNLRCGDEIQQDFITLGHGIYLLMITTAKSRTVRKFICQ